jgi:PIN domain nuclease of toxin-antitoxin system
VKVLLDTHAILWFMLEDSNLSNRATSILSDPTNLCLFSPASHWEIAIKISIGKYNLSGDFENLWRDVLEQFNALPIVPRHTAKLISLPFHHKDPFDRLIIAQALTEQVPLVSSDPRFNAYGVERIW